MGKMQKKTLKIKSKCVSKAENLIVDKWFFFFKGDQINLPKIGQDAIWQGF
jgi:hypothetical protein